MRFVLGWLTLVVTVVLSPGTAHAQLVDFARQRIGVWDIKCQSTYLPIETGSRIIRPQLTDVRCDAKSEPLSFAIKLTDRENTYIGLDVESDHSRIYDAIAFDKRSYALARMDDAREPFSKLRYTDVDLPGGQPCQHRYQPNCEGAKDLGISHLAIQVAPGFWMNIQRFIPMLFSTHYLWLRYRQYSNDPPYIENPSVGKQVRGAWTYHWQRYDVSDLSKVAEWSERAIRSPRSRLFNQPKQSSH